MNNEFVYKDKKYVRIDFKNQFTFEQADLFEPISDRVTEVALLLSKEAKNLPVLTEENKEDKEFLQLKQNAELKLATQLKGMYDSNVILPELLAHVWFDETDSEFNIDTFKQRVIMFKKMPIGVREKLELEGAINDFLYVAMKSSTGGILSLLPTAKK